jgi:pimeloyl-ACP methyl ester carboxylesterase
MSIPPYARVLVPDYIGLAEELQHADRELPAPQDVLQCTAEFLDVALRQGSSCNAVGTSLGGGLLYFLRAMRPELIQKTVLVAPTIPSVLADHFVSDDDTSLGDCHNPLVGFGCRDEAAREALFRNFLWTDPTARGKEKEALPITALSFVLENMYQTSLRDFFYQDHKLPASDEDQDSDSAAATSADETAAATDSTTTTSIFATTTDVDQDCNRLLVWPEEDQISDVEKGKQFFGPSLESGTTRIETIPGCGHMFDADLKLVYDRIPPSVGEFLLDFSEE